ncbi:XRE family transcriptional regulator [Alcanivorax sp.]|jgi:predicted XRE-type DNA-binding protein|uniref:helix-turn-helix domain-containing protein n=1 Tax=Alcanivorax sp. TaxID=1872427 RepID=UPI0032D974C7
MALKFYDSPFHVTHTEKVASKMAMKVDLSIMISQQIRERGWTQVEAASELAVSQARISQLKNAKVENFTIDAMFDILDHLGFRSIVKVDSVHRASISISDNQALAV